MKKTFKFGGLLLAAVLAATAVAAQDALYETQGLPAGTSIVREYAPGVDIVYHDNGTPSFLYLDRMSQVIEEARIPNLVSVADMEIEGDMVYFCGNYNGDQAIGRFDINDLFFGSNNVEFSSIMYYPVSGSYPGTLTLTKLEVYKDVSDVHVFLIGNIEFGTPNAIDYTCLIDAQYDGSRWFSEVIEEPTGVYFFDDVAVLDNEIVVVGDKHGGTGDYSNIWYLPSTGWILSSIAGGDTLDICYTGDNEYFPISKPLIEHLDNDRYAVACYGMFEGDTGIVVTLYDNFCTMNTRWFVYNMTSTTAFSELRYNANDNALYLLPDATNTAVQGMVYVFDLATMQVSLSQSALPRLYSASNANSAAGAVVSGETVNGEFGLWRMRVSDCKCSQSIVPPSVANAYLTHRYHHECRTDWADHVPYQETAGMQHHDFPVFCGEDIFD